MFRNYLFADLYKLQIWLKMYAKKNVDKKMDSKGLTVLGYLNLEKSVYLSESKAGDNKKRYLVKTIPLYSDSPQFQSTQ